MRSTKEGLWSLRGRNLKVNEAQPRTDRPLRSVIMEMRWQSHDCGPDFPLLKPCQKTFAGKWDILMMKSSGGGTGFQSSTPSKRDLDKGGRKS